MIQQLATRKFDHLPPLTKGARGILSLLFEKISPHPSFKKRGVSASSGFTLIELLTVIFIIGILTTVITVNLSSARKQARDVRRKTDLSTIQSALELYANANNGKVPVTVVAGITTFPVVTPPWITGLSAYVSAPPVDPTNDAAYYYTYISDGSHYAVDAILETEPAANANLPTTPTTDTTLSTTWVTGTYSVGTTPAVVHYRVSSGQ